MGGASVLANQVFGKLLINRTSYATVLAQSELPKRRQKELFLFLDCRYLVQADQKLSRGKKNSDLLFHDLLRECSPLYRRVFEMSTALDVPFHGVIKSAPRFSTEFDPLSLVVGFPPIKDELYWLVEKEINLDLIEQYCGLIRYSVPVFHDLLHSVMSRLIPYSSTTNMKDYLLFIEALVLPLEGYVNVELGHHFYGAIAETGTLWRRPVPGDSRKVEFEAGFREALLGNIAAKKNRPTKETRSWLPGYLRKIRSAQLAEAKKSQLHPIFKIPECGLESLRRNPERVEELWNWYRDSFFPNRPTSRSRS